MTAKKKKPMLSKRFEPELDGLGRVQSTVKAKDMPRRDVSNTALGSALQAALANAKTVR